MSLLVSPLARSDLRSIALTIKADNGPAVAERIIFRITTAMRRLEEFPKLGRTGRLPGTRELGVGNLPFIVVYQLRPDTIAILRVIHGAMQWPSEH